MAQTENKRYIFYLGQDVGYWQSLQNKFTSTYPDHELEFENQNLSSPLEYQKIFPSLAEKDMHIVFIDYSVNTKVMFTLAKMFRRIEETKKVIIVGLLDNLASTNECIMANMSGVHFVHKKNAELHDVVYDPYFLSFFDDVKKPEFAVAKGENKEIKAYELMRACFMTPSSIRIETNRKLTEKSEVSLKTFFFKGESEDIIPSNKFTVKKQHSTNYYYDHDYIFDLEFHLVDPPKEEEEADEAEKKDEYALSYEDQLKQTQKKLDNYIKDNLDRVKPKKTKIFIIDRNLSILSNFDEPIFSSPYSIRFQKTVRGDLAERMNRQRPSLIAFEYEKVPKQEPEGPVIDPFDFNGPESLSQVMGVIQSIDKYNPIVLVFNIEDADTAQLQKQFSYKQVMANKEHINIENVQKFADIYEKNYEKKLDLALQTKLVQLKKQDSSYARLNKEDLREKKIYFAKGKVNSCVLMGIELRLAQVSETEMVAFADRPLKLGTILFIEEPVPYFLTIVPHNEGSDFIKEENCYHAVLHSISEEGKQKIRQFVNSLFFIKKDADKQKELDEFNKLNKDTKEKIEQEKKDQEIIRQAEEKKKLEEQKLKEEEIKAKEEERLKAEATAVKEKAEQAATQTEAEDSEKDSSGPQKKSG